MDLHEENNLYGALVHYQPTLGDSESWEIKEKSSDVVVHDE